MTTSWQAVLTFEAFHQVTHQTATPRIHHVPSLKLLGSLVDMASFQGTFQEQSIALAGYVDLLRLDLFSNFVSNVVTMPDFSPPLKLLHSHHCCDGLRHAKRRQGDELRMWNSRTEKSLRWFVCISLFSMPNVFFYNDQGMNHLTLNLIG